MAAFRFQASDASGRVRRGVIEVDGERQARVALRSRGLWVLEVRPLAGRSTPWRLRRRLPAAELALLLRQLATLIGARLTIELSLSALIEQAESQRAREVLAGLRGQVRAGHTLAAAARSSGVFPETVCTLIAAGERSGRLGEVLVRVADYAERSRALRSKVGLALIYPLIVIAVATVVIIALMTYVVPQVVGVFQREDYALPWLTLVLIALSDFLRAFGVYLLVVLSVLALLAGRALRRPAVRVRFETSALRLPLVGPLMRGAAAARFASTLAVLVESGVPVLDALRSAAGVVGNLPMRASVEETERAVREGASLSRALGRTGMFPPLLVHLAANGEASGELGVMLARAADNEERNLAQRVTLLMALLEPLLILVMGGVVLFIVLATLMPIVELNYLVR